MEGLGAGKVTKHTGLRCLLCKDEIFSLYRHDFRKCSCGECFVDGGFDYLRFGYNDKTNVETIEKDIKKITKKEELNED